MSHVRAFESTMVRSPFFTSGVGKTAITRSLIHYPTRSLCNSPLISTTLAKNVLYGSSSRRITSLRCFSALTPELKTTLDKVVGSHKVLLFMKGTKDFPQCGFSNTVVQILKSFNVPFETVDILENELLRQGLKEYSSWPTFPQLYIDGEFFGGCDITVGVRIDSQKLWKAKDKKRHTRAANCRNCWRRQCVLEAHHSGDKLIANLDLLGMIEKCIA